MRAILLATTALIVAGTSAFAAEQNPAPSGNVMDAIVVTAQKRPESLKNVPIAVTVINKDQLTAEHIQVISDLARTSPSLEMIQAFGGPGGGGQIRGLGTQSFTRSAEGAVGIVVDGVPQGNVPNNAIFDLSRVEVLRGPQGTLFGLTTSAGVINTETVAPNVNKMSGYIHFDGSGDGTAGSEYGQAKVVGAINVPLASNAALRIAGNYNRLSGVQRNAYNNQANVSDDAAIRARFLWKPTDTITINLIGDYDSRRQNYGDPQFDYVNVAPGTPLAAQLAACGIVASWDNNARCSNMDNFVRNKNFGFSGQIDIALAGGTLTSITGYRKNIQDPSNVDIMGNPQEFTQIFYSGQINNAHQFSQELRFTSAKGKPIDYTVGLFFSDYRATAGYVPGGGFIVGSYQIAPFFIPFVQDGSSTYTTNRSYAAFGQANYHITESLTVLAGLRFTHQSLSDSQSTNPYAMASVATYGALTKSNLSGKIGVLYKVDPSLNVYATVTRGYKGPQVNPAALGAPATIIGAEIPTAWELGAKGSALGGALGYDASLFLTRVSNYQGQRCTITAVGVLSCIGESIPSVTSKGIELSAFGKPVNHLSINAGFIYNVATFPQGFTGYNPNDLTGATSTDMSGLQVVGAPRTKFTLSADYTVPMGPVESYVGGDLVAKSSMRLGYSGDPRFVYPADVNLSLRLGVRSPDHKWSAEIFARNLTKDREPATLFGGPSFLPPGAVPFLPNGQINGVSGWATTASRRQVGLSVEAQF